MRIYLQAKFSKLHGNGFLSYFAENVKSAEMEIVRVNSRVLRMFMILFVNMFLAIQMLWADSLHIALIELDSIVIAEQLKYIQYLEEGIELLLIFNFVCISLSLFFLLLDGGIFEWLNLFYLRRKKRK